MSTYFTGPKLIIYKKSICKRCLGCQAMENEDFIPRMACNNAVLVAGDNDQIEMALNTKGGGAYAPGK